MLETMLILWTMLACLVLFGIGIFALLAPGGQTGLATTLILLAAALSYAAIVGGLEEWGWRHRSSRIPRTPETPARPRTRQAPRRGKRREGKAAIGVATG